MADTTSTTADHPHEAPAPLPHQHDSLESCIRHRHSIRFYKPDPVPRSLLHHCLTLAQLAPSNSNIQNWRVTLASGAAKDRIVADLLAAASAGTPKIPPLPEQFRHFRSEFGHLLYGSEGYSIERHEREKHAWATKRNYEYFGAPVVGVITMDKTLAPVDAMSVGMFVQTFMLALTECGVGSCLEVSVTGYPEVLRKGFGLDDGLEILCGIAIGWPAEGNRVNELKVPREKVEECVRFLEE